MTRDTVLLPRCSRGVPVRVVADMRRSLEDAGHAGPPTSPCRPNSRSMPAASRTPAYSDERQRTTRRWYGRFNERRGRPTPGCVVQMGRHGHQVVSLKREAHCGGQAAVNTLHRTD
jgi:hypothetical protein